MPKSLFDFMVRKLRNAVLKFLKGNTQNPLRKYKQLFNWSNNFPNVAQASPDRRQQGQFSFLAITLIALRVMAKIQAF